MSQPAGRALRRTLRRAAILIVLLGLALAAVLGLAVRSALGARADLQSARETLASVQAGTDADTDLDTVRSRTSAAHAHIADAQRQLSSPAVAIAARLPVLGRSWRVSRLVADTSDAVLDGVEQGLEATAATAATDDGSTGDLALGRLSSLAEPVGRSAVRARELYTELASSSTAWTPTSVVEGVAQARAGLAPTVRALERAAAGARVGQLLLAQGSTRSVFVALENNAELRGTGGYVSTYAAGTLASGSLSLRPPADIIAVGEPPSQARRVPAPAAYRRAYGPFLADTTLLRNWTLSPDIPTSASVAAAALGLVTGSAPDLVLLLDVPALQALAELSGQPIELADGTVVSPEELGQQLLVESYAGGLTEQAQTRRRDELRQAAGETVPRLLEGNVAPLDLLRTLSGLASGRHLALWSADPGLQGELVEVGVAGEIAPGEDDLALVTVNNFGENKLDVYVDREVEIDAVVGARTTRVVQRLRLTNRAPADLVPYVAGRTTPGVLSERIEFGIGRRASVESFRQDGEPSEVVVDDEGAWTRLTTNLTLAREASTTFELRYTVPSQDGYRLDLIPQPLAEDATLTVRLRAADGRRLRDEFGAQLTGDAVSTGPWETQSQVTVHAVGADGLGRRLLGLLPGF